MKLMGVGSSQSFDILFFHKLRNCSLPVTITHIEQKSHMQGCLENLQ